MNFQDDLDRERRRKSDNDAASAGETSGSGERATRSRKRNGQPAEVGDALRTVYQRTIDEDIPPEMLDLLGKLG